MTSPLGPRPPRSAVLGDEVYERLGAAILDGSLPPGQHLRDHELAERLGVSRTPVREALQRLERAGLVEVAPHRYTRVSVPTQRIADDTLEFVIYFMGNLLHLSARRADDVTLAAIVGRVDVMVEASRIDDVARVITSTAEFLIFTTHATGNLALIRVLRESQVALRRNLANWHPHLASPTERTAAFEAMRDALARRDGITAEAIMREVNGFS